MGEVMGVLQRDVLQVVMWQDIAVLLILNIVSLKSHSFDFGRNNVKKIK